MGSRADNLNTVQDSSTEVSGRGRTRSRSKSKTRKSAATRSRIMSCASDLMRERGNTSFKMSEISDMCEMSKGALYYYFKNRDDLIKAIFEDAATSLAADMDKIIANSDSAIDAMQWLCAGFARRVTEHGSLTMALVNELMQSHDGLAPMGDARIKHIVGALAKLIDQGKEEGTIRADVKSHLTAVAICGALSFAALSVTTDTDDAEQLDLGAKLFSGLYTGLKAREA